MSRLFSKTKLIFSELIVFLLIQIFGLLTGWRMFNLLQWRQTFKFSSYNLSNFFIGFVLALLFISLFLKIFRKHNLPFRLFFYFLVFLTSLTVFSIWLPEVLAFALVIVLFLILYFWSNILTQNFTIAIMSVGTGIFLGLGFEPEKLIIILIVLAVYDIVAVFVSGHMIRMFKEMVSHKFVLALIIPRTSKGWLTKISQVQINGDFTFLGTGDLVLPMALAVSSLRQNLWAAIFVIFGALLGLTALLCYFFSQKKHRPLPALPPIIAGAIFGYLVSLNI